MPTRRKVKPAPMAQIVRRIPRRDPRQHIHDQLVEIWESGMTPAEREGWSQFWRGESDGTTVSPKIFDQLDELIIRQAETLGWRITCSPLVSFRLSVWDSAPGGLELSDRFYDALRRWGRIVRGLKPAPITDPDLPQFRRETVDELDKLLRKMREALATRRQISTPGEVAGLFRETVVGEPLFVHLNQTLESWLAFLASKSVPPIVSGRTASPASLFDSWFGWSSSLVPEYVRQKLSSRF